MKDPKYIWLAICAIILCFLCSSCSMDTASFSISQCGELSDYSKESLQNSTYDFGTYKGQEQDMRYYPIKKAAKESLDKRGMRQIERNSNSNAPNNQPDYTVILLYGLTNVSNKERDVAQFGVTDYGGYNNYTIGVTSYNAYGPSRSWHNATVYQPPTFGVTGYETVSYKEYGHKVMVVIKDKNWRTVYVATAESVSRTADLNSFSYKMTKRLLDNFPKERHSGRALNAVFVN